METPTWKRILRVVVGAVLVLLGIAGMFLPFLQGFLLLFAGIFVLSHDVPQLRRVRNALRRRFPGLSRSAERVRRKVRRATDRVLGRDTSRSDSGQG